MSGSSTQSLALTKSLSLWLYFLRILFILKIYLLIFIGKEDLHKGEDTEGKTWALVHYPSDQNGQLSRSEQEP